MIGMGRVGGKDIPMLVQRAHSADQTGGAAGRERFTPQPKQRSGLRRIISVVGTLGLMLASIGALTIVPATVASASSFSGFSPPITGATDFATNFPSGGIGPIGMIDDGTNFFVANFGNGLLYKFSTSGGDASTVPSAPDGLFGLTLSHGVYFGTNLTGTIQTFNPTTLAVTPTNASTPCGNEGIAADPLTTDLYVGTQCGVYRVQNPTSVSPTVTLFSASTHTFDGISISTDGQQIWAADTSVDSAVEFDRSGAVLNSISDSGGPDGIGIAEPGVISNGINVSNNVFINNNNGTITRVDTNNGNAVSIVATGGTRGDMAITGPDGCLYVTQSDRVEKLAPCFFQPPPPPTGCSSSTRPTVTHVFPLGNAKLELVRVLILGTCLAGAEHVNFGTVPTTAFSVGYLGGIVASPPPQVAGTVDVTVTTPGGTSAPNPPADQYTYYLPKVLQVVPNHGPATGGNTVVIHGLMFSGPSLKVSFGTANFSSSVTVLNDTTIRALVPPHASGTVDVQVTAFTGPSLPTGSDLYTYK